MKYKNIKVSCAYCKKEWVDDVEFKDGYEYGYSICKECGDKMYSFNRSDSDSFVMGRISPDDMKLYSDLSDRDREKYRGSPCTWCGKKSMMRTRIYNIDADFKEPTIISACETHVDEFKKHLERETK